MKQLFETVSPKISTVRRRVRNYTRYTRVIGERNDRHELKVVFNRRNFVNYIAFVVCLFGFF